MKHAASHLYRPVLRPPGYATLPHGVRWDFVEVPPRLAHMRPDLPVSAYYYGIISTDRELTARERATFDLAIYVQGESR